MGFFKNLFSRKNRSAETESDTPDEADEDSVTIELVLINDQMPLYAYKDGSPPDQGDIEQMMRGSFLGEDDFRGSSFTITPATFQEASEHLRKAHESGNMKIEVPDNREGQVTLRSAFAAMALMNQHGIDNEGRGISARIAWSSSDDLDEPGSMCLVAILWAPKQD